MLFKPRHYSQVHSQSGDAWQGLSCESNIFFQSDLFFALGLANNCQHYQQRISCTLFPFNALRAHIENAALELNVCNCYTSNERLHPVEKDVMHSHYKYNRKNGTGIHGNDEWKK